MPDQFDPHLITSVLSRLSRRHAVAFAGACCERLLPNYKAFSEAEAWGDWSLLRQALDEIWAYVAGGEVPQERIRELLERCDQVIPDTEDFGTIGVSQALDAGVSICEALELIQDGDVAHAVTAGSQARDTVDMFIQDRDDMDYKDPLFEEKILSDPLMVRELHHQKATLLALAAANPLTGEFIRALRQEFLNRSNVR